MAHHASRDDEPVIRPVPDRAAAGRRGRGVWVIRGVAVLAALVVVVGAVVIATTGASSSDPDATSAAPLDQVQVVAPRAQEPDPVLAPVPVSDTELGALPQATTFGTVSTAPKDENPAVVPTGRIVHPSATVPVYRAPGDAAIAALPAQQVGSDTWLPVIDERPGWVRVLLPIRPGGSTGWLFLDDERISLARTSFRVLVDRASYTLTVYDGEQQTGRWTVGVGKPNSVTPQGRTFLLASIKDTRPTFSPIVLPLGTHSDTYTSYGGGPGTVGVHTWPKPEVYGTASSDGCIRVPPEALAILSSQVPLGTPVLIS